MNNNKKKTIITFKKAKGLTEKIINMLEEEEYCIDIMQQNLAVIGLLKSAHLHLLENHLKTCFQKAMETKDKKKQKQMAQEILTVTKLFNK